MRLGGGGDRFEQWAETADPDDIALVGDVLLSVNDGTWRERYGYVPDVTRPGYAFIITPRPDLVVVIRFYPDYPSDFTLDYVGSPDDH